jgi:hypothetical protein
MKIGIVDLDTSHPASWIPIERELGHEVVGLYDGGAAYDRPYVERFAAEHDLPRVFDSLAEMADEVDCAVIHGCDWDTHIAKAGPFVEAGKAVLIDKPLAGNGRDLQQILEWSRQGVRITGGSSLRFCPEAAEWLARPIEERGQPDTVFCGCGVDDYNYGIHGYALLSSIMGPGAISVQHLGRGAQRRVQIHWPDGRTGILVIGASEKWLPFHASIVTACSTHQFIVDNSRIYRALLVAVLPYLAGRVDHPPIPMHKLIEPERCALAARKSWQDSDRQVQLDELEDSDDGYDGAAFAEAYRRSKL